MSDEKPTPRTMADFPEQHVETTGIRLEDLLRPLTPVEKTLWTLPKREPAPEEPTIRERRPTPAVEGKTPPYSNLGFSCTGKDSPLVIQLLGPDEELRGHTKLTPHQARDMALKILAVYGLADEPATSAPLGERFDLLDFSE